MRRSSIVAGIILIFAGLFFLLLPLFPNLISFIDIEQQWPFIIIAIGALFLLGALSGVTGLAIPGSVIVGIGGLLYYQNLNDAWETWSFAWALIPGFVGLGVILARLLEGDTRRGLREGGRLIIIALILFIIFGALLSGWFSSGIIWALLLIGVGLWLLFRTLIGGGRKENR